MTASGRATGWVLLALGLGACTTTSYYWQAARGHFDLMSHRRPITAVIADPATPAALRTRLERVRALRSFAVSDLGLPDNGSYRSYVALDRPYVIWNVFAAPPLSIEPRTWCFPVAGCVAYRGYFARADAEAQAAERRADGDDTYVGGVPAYSSLGWMDDPVLSTFVDWPEVELARLLFHELGHQIAYASGDTAFNEAFATSVEEVGVARWIAHTGRPGLAQEWQDSQRHREDFQRLLLQAQHDLGELYQSPLGESAMRAAKTARLVRLQDDYQALKTRWGGFSGYDHWFAGEVNNARLASVAVYTAQVPAFLALLRSVDDQLPVFYQRVQALARLDQTARSQALEAALAANPGGTRQNAGSP